MASFFDIHLLLPIFDWLEDSSISFLYLHWNRDLHRNMFKENEIAKARYSVLTKTNMLEYACEVYRGIYNTKENPKGLYNDL